MPLFFGFMRRKKKKSAREAKERLGAMLSTRKRSVPVEEILGEKISKESVGDVEHLIKRWAVERFKVGEKNIKVEFEEHNGYVVIITNITFD